MLFTCYCGSLVLIALILSSSSLESSGLLTAPLRCWLETNLRPKSPSLFIPFSFCIFTSCRYILVCELLGADVGVGIRGGTRAHYCPPPPPHPHQHHHHHHSCYSSDDSRDNNNNAVINNDHTQLSCNLGPMDVATTPPPFHSLIKSRCIWILLNRLI